MTNAFPSVISADNVVKTIYNNSTGEDDSHNNIQPYITVYMYKRTFLFV